MNRLINLPIRCSSLASIQNRSWLFPCEARRRALRPVVGSGFRGWFSLSILAIVSLLIFGCGQETNVDNRVQNGFIGPNSDPQQEVILDAGTAPSNAPLNRFPRANEILVNEIFYDPINGLEDLYAEWVEIINISADSLSLDDCAVSDDAHVDDPIAQADLSGIVIEPGGILLVARSNDPLLNGGLSPDAVFEFGMGNGGDTVLLKCGDTIIDSVSYDSGTTFPNASGRSIQRDNTDWCPGDSVYHAPTQQKGSPGRANPPCILNSGSCWSDLDCEGEGRCEEDVCTQSTTTSLGCTDDGDCNRDARCTAGQCVELDVMAGDVMENEIVITEFLYDPVDALSDLKAEWIELKNTSNRILSLEGCSVVDNTDVENGAILDGLVVAPGQFLLLARNDDPLENGGLSTDTIFRFNLNNSGDQIRLICNGVVIDEVSYGSGVRRASGASLSRSGPVMGMRSTSETLWCEGQLPYITEPIHLGTPGAENPPCQN